MFDGNSVFWKKLGLLSSVPLAVTLSFLPDNFAEGVLLAANVQAASSIDAPKPTPQDSKAVQLKQLLIENGYNEKLAQDAVSYATCASNLNDSAYLWQRGERHSGIFMISDAKQAACGHGKLEIWQFRALMQNRAAAAQCRSILEKRGLLDDPVSWCRKNGPQPQVNNISAATKI